MKKMKLAALALSLVGILAAGNAFAADTATVDVSATVLGSCSFNVANPVMAFGNIDPTSGATYPATADLNFTCTNGTAYTLDDVSGTNKPFAQAGLTFDVAGYTLNGSGTGAAQTVTLNGSIAPAQYASATAGSYTQTLTVNINP